MTKAQNISRCLRTEWEDMKQRTDWGYALFFLFLAGMEGIRMAIYLPMASYMWERCHQQICGCDWHFCGTGFPDTAGQAFIVSNAIIFLLVALVSALLWRTMRRSMRTTAARFYELTTVMYLLHTGFMVLIGLCYKQRQLIFYDQLGSYYGIIVVWMTIMVCGAVIGSKGLRVFGSLNMAGLALIFSAQYFVNWVPRYNKNAGWRPFDWLPKLHRRRLDFFYGFCTEQYGRFNWYNALERFELDARTMIGLTALLCALYLMVRGLVTVRKQATVGAEEHRRMCVQVFSWMGLCELLKTVVWWSMHLYQRFALMGDEFTRKDKEIEWFWSLMVWTAYFVMLMAGMWMLARRTKRKWQVDTNVYRLAATMAAVGLVLAWLSSTMKGYPQLLIRCSGLGMTAILMYWTGTHERTGAARGLKIGAVLLLLAAAPLLASMFRLWYDLYIPDVRQPIQTFNRLYLRLIAAETILPLSGIGFSLWHFRKSRTE